MAVVSNQDPRQTRASALAVDRFGAICGLASAALMVAAGLVVAAPPESDVAAGTIQDYLIGHQSRLSVNTVLTGLGSLAVLGFFGVVHRRFTSAGEAAEAVRGVFLLGAAVAVICTLLGAVTQAALVHQIAPLGDAEMSAAFYALWDRVFHTAPALGMAVALLAASLAGLRRALPRWISILGVLTAALITIDGVEDLATSGTHLGQLGLAAVGLAILWIVAISVDTLRHPRALDPLPNTPEAPEAPDAI